MKVYKFRSWGKKYEKALFSRNMMYFSSPARFNDPFDFKVPIRYELETDEYLKSYFRELFISNGGFHTETEIQNAIDTALKLVRSPSIKNKQTIEKGQLIDKQYGVFSLSQSYQHNLLWSHYADCHKGYCLEFDLKKLEEYFETLYRTQNLLIITLLIEYREQMPIIRPSMTTIWEGSELKYKSKVWDYEKEIRLVLCGATNKSINYPPECVSSIILGCEMNLSHKQEIYQIVSNRIRKPKILEAIRDPYSFELSFEEFSKL